MTRPGTAAAMGPLMEACFRVGPDGVRAFSDEDIRHFLPLLVVRLGIPVAALGEGVRVLLGAVAARAGVTAGLGAQATLALVEAYYRAHPVLPALEAAFDAALRTARLAARRPQAQRDVARLQGGGRRPTPVHKAAGAKLGHAGMLLRKLSTTG